MPQMGPLPWVYLLFYFLSVWYGFASLFYFNPLFKSASEGAKSVKEGVCWAWQ